MEEEKLEDKNLVLYPAPHTQYSNLINQISRLLDPSFKFPALLHCFMKCNEPGRVRVHHFPTQIKITIVFTTSKQ